MAPPKGSRFKGAGPGLYYQRAPMSDGSKKTLAVLGPKTPSRHSLLENVAEVNSFCDIPRDGTFHFHRNSIEPNSETAWFRSVYGAFEALGPGLHLAYRSFDIAAHDGEWGERWMDRERAVEYTKLYVMRDPL